LLICHSLPPVTNSALFICRISHYFTAKCYTLPLLLSCPGFCTATPFTAILDVRNASLQNIPSITSFPLYTSYNPHIFTPYITLDLHISCTFSKIFTLIPVFFFLLNTCQWLLRSDFLVLFSFVLVTSPWAF
jgi:hypothetical protein